METKRLFIGTYVDNTLFKSVINEIEDDFNKVCSGKWVELDNMHFTYKFLGNVAVDKISEIQNALADVIKYYDSPLQIKGLGVFPHISNPKILFAKVFNQDKNVLYAFNKIEKIMSDLGFPKEKKKFFSHITLLRLKSANTEIFADILNDYKDFNIGLMPNFSINLIESTLTNKGPIYNIIK